MSTPGALAAPPIQFRAARKMPQNPEALARISEAIPTVRRHPPRVARISTSAMSSEPPLLFRRHDTTPESSVRFKRYRAATNL